MKTKWRKLRVPITADAYERLYAIAEHEERYPETQATVMLRRVLADETVIDDATLAAGAALPRTDSDWKWVCIRLSHEEYARLEAIADREARSVDGQAIFMLRRLIAAAEAIHATSLLRPAVLEHPDIALVPLARPHDGRVSVCQR